MLDLTTIPSTNTIISHEGYVFEIDSTTWKISRQHNVNLKWVEQLLLPDFAKSFKHVLGHYAQKYSSAHTNNQYLRFHHFALERYQQDNQCLSKISAQALISYRASLDREHEYYLGTLRGFLKSWFDLGYEGLEDGVMDLLGNWRLRGNIKGRAVQTLCPNAGPLSDLEFAALNQRLIEEFEQGSIIACYTCRNFQPWVDGPHELVLSSLIAERDRILEITKDKVMAAVNDRTILAVTQVIQICEKRRPSQDEEVLDG